MPDPGPKPKVTDDEILNLLKAELRPVWSASNLAEEFGITRQTAYSRLENLAESTPDVERVSVGNATAYYVPGINTGPPDPGGTTAERHRASLIHEFTDSFVGRPTAPWTAVHPNDGPAEAGDKVQIRVEGEPGRWGPLMTHAWPNRRDELLYEETSSDETQALISGELYAKPTVPIEHENYHQDYDLELNIGAEYEEIETDGNIRQILIAAGVKNYLIKPCNNAVFLKNVSVDWLSPKGHGQELETFELTNEMVQSVEEREEDIEARDEHKDSDSSEDLETEPPGLEFLEQMLDAAEPAEGWLKNVISVGAISLNEDVVELLVEHPNSPVDSEEDIRNLVEEAAEDWGGEEDHE